MVDETVELDALLADALPGRAALTQCPWCLRVRTAGGVFGTRAPTVLLDSVCHEMCPTCGTKLLEQIRWRRASGRGRSAVDESPETRAA